MIYIHCSCLDFYFPLATCRSVNHIQASLGRVLLYPTPQQFLKRWREICPCTSKPTNTLSLRTSLPVCRTQVEVALPGKTSRRWMTKSNVWAECWRYLLVFIFIFILFWHFRWWLILTMCHLMSPRWLQPDSYADPQKTSLILNKDDIRCGWPATVVVQTKDQYGDVVHVPNMKVRRSCSFYI